MMGFGNFLDGTEKYKLIVDNLCEIDLPFHLLIQLSEVKQ